LDAGADAVKPSLDHLIGKGGVKLGAVDDSAIDHHTIHQQRARLETLHLTSSLNFCLLRDKKSASTARHHAYIVKKQS
jgi:hypothetical protein